MEEERVEKIYEILNNIPVTSENFNTIEKIREALLNKDYISALKKLETLNKMSKKQAKKQEVQKVEKEEIR